MAILDGKAVAAAVRARVKAEVAALQAAHGVTPQLKVVLVGDDPASQSYVRGKEKQAREAGMGGETLRLPGDATQERVAGLVRELVADPEVDGILVQLPLPAHLDPEPVLLAIDPAKDVDGLHPLNAGRLMTGRSGLVPCTPRGIMHLLDHAGVTLAGRHAVVVGRSNLVGKPVALLLLARHATVTVCHSRTADLAGMVRGADVLVAAVGKPEMIRGEWIAPGATVIDVGINRVGERLVGDVEYAPAAARAAWITPVPGGVGPMTVACLLENTVQAAKARRGL
ncbi:MAG TPA: bifunctional methylenetetrahydrofolate dehydrogenase/methenyltetrahydrofolate cyclohydrolase FolD [Myxococcota bacterium]|jgi:methylenetetrahydrofolate dehydrogenase (NADP+)/methenyltetrahydrofolate cyclohydrolase|nr:bifunctional methylenetetrahydrofolate dehydrogenase/methenyltetrahydrofolate cyclohydrolase FolD [Myxococcota bacterium]